MPKTLPLETLVIAPEIARALSMDLPVVALESTVITHGLPYPENLQLARDMEQTVRSQGATPATIAVLSGKIMVGLNDIQLESLARGTTLSASVMKKISVRDFASAIAKQESGGTTVAATLFAAHAAGIRVFATGGIGGVHRGAPFDVSADLVQLSKSPVVVVCAGAKAILDLPATLEVLETYGVPVVGFRTDDFPAFYSQKSGLKTSACADSALEVARIARAHWALGMQSAILVTVPPPEESALPNERIEKNIHTALKEASEKKIRGQEVTPFLLKRISELSGGESLSANLALLINNARVAALIAREMKES